MNVFTILKLLGSQYVNGLILHSLTHNMSEAGRQALAANLTVAATDLTANNFPGAADAITAIVLSIH